MKSLQDWITEKTQKIADVGTIPMDKAGLCWDITGRETGPILDYHVVNLDAAEAGHNPDANLWDRAGRYKRSVHRGLGAQSAINPAREVRRAVLR